MKQKLFTCIVAITMLCGKAQPLQNFSYRFVDSEDPLGFVKYNNYSICFSRTADLGTNIKFRALALNTEGTVRFNTILTETVVSLVKQPINSNNHVAVCSPTHDKGLLVINSLWQCTWPSGNFNIHYYSRIDSLGNIIYSNPAQFGECRGIGSVSNTFYYISAWNHLRRLNFNTGALTSTITTESDEIRACSNNSKQQIVYTTTNTIRVIDTLGATLASTVATTDYSKIKCYKKDYYFLSSNGTFIHKMDSDLNLKATYNATNVNSITDFSIHNDSVFVAIYGAYPRSVIDILSTNSLSVIGSNTVGIDQHKITSIYKDNNYHFLSQEARGMVNFNTGYQGHFSSTPVHNTGFSSFQSLNAINYPADIILKSIKTQTFYVTGYTQSGFGDYYSFSYQHAIVIFNNSSDTVKRFQISHPKYTSTPHSHCDHPALADGYKMNYSLTIAPFDSIEVQIPLFNGTNTIIAVNNSITIPFCYNVSLPNNQLENNLNNSNLCVNLSTLGIGLNEYEISQHINVYPNPANHTLHFDKEISYAIVYDVRGILVLKEANVKGIDISALECGLYFIFLHSDLGTTTRKFIISR